jgi:hypothetical protein
MGFFFLKALAAITIADAIDRDARGRPAKYWYPSQPGLPATGTSIPYVASIHPPPPAPAAPLPVAPGWDPHHPERPA